MKPLHKLVCYSPLYEYYDVKEGTIKFRTSAASERQNIDHRIFEPGTSNNQNLQQVDLYPFIYLCTIV